MIESYNDLYENRLVSEIVKKGNLEKYQPIVIDILNLIYSHGFKVSCREDSLQSSIKWDEKWIQLSVKKNDPFHLHVLWSLIHETGHLVNGYNRSQSESEQLAWDYAFQFIERYPKLMENLSFLVLYRDYCLKSYNLRK